MAVRQYRHLPWVAGYTDRMSLEAWLVYVAATAILLVIPGPTILTVISYSMAQGKCARLLAKRATS